MDQRGDHRADARRRGDVLRRGGQQRVGRAELLGQAAAGDEADALDPDRVEHGPEGPLARGVDRGDEVARRHGPDARQLAQALRSERVEVGRGVEQPRRLQRRDLLLAHAVHVHHAGVGLEQLPAAVGAVAVGAPGEDAALERRGVADGAAGGRLLRRVAVGVLDSVRRRGDDLRDHVAGTHGDHLVAGPDVLADQVLLVVQRRHLHGDAADLHRLEHGERVQVAELAHVPLDLPHAGHGGRRRELPRDGPARVPADRPEPALQLEVVDLHDHAVDLEVELPAPLPPGLACRDHLVLGGELGDVRVHAEAVRPQPLERLGVRGEGEALRRADAVAPHGERALRREGRVELADGSRRRVAGVHERGEALLRPALVEGLEVRERHVDLAAHLDQRRGVRDPQRDGAHRPQVVGDVLADLAVAARGAALQDAVAVHERDREPIDLRLGDVAERRVLDALAREVRAHPGHPAAQLLGGADVGERQHRLRVADLREPGDGLAADPLRGRVRGDEAGMLRLDRAQLVQQRVVRVVADLRVVEDVVAVRVVRELLTKRGGALGRGAHPPGRGAHPPGAGEGLIRSPPRRARGAARGHTRATSRSPARPSGRSGSA